MRGGERLPVSLQTDDMTPLPSSAQQLLEVQEKCLPSSRHRGPRSNVSGAGPAGRGLLRVGSKRERPGFILWQPGGGEKGGPHLAPSLGLG